MKNGQQILSDDIKKLELIHQRMNDQSIWKHFKIESLLQEINNRIQTILQILESEFKRDQQSQNLRIQSLSDINKKMQENLDSDLVYSFKIEDLSKEQQSIQLQESNNRSIADQEYENRPQTERIQKKTVQTQSLQINEKKKMSFMTFPDQQQRKIDNVWQINEQNNNQKELQKIQEIEQKTQTQKQNKQFLQSDQQQVINIAQINNSKIQQQYQQQKQQQKPNILPNTFKMKENMTKFKMKIVSQVPTDGNINKCPICQENCFSDIGVQDQQVISLSCSHQVHYSCLEPILNQDYVKCPICNKITGNMIGDQPDGEMNVQKIRKICDGYDCDSIQITYTFKSGRRNGKDYQGITRVAYLPDNYKGQQVLNLLKKAFDQKLIFTIGTSLTTGQDNCLIWNGIHHKTNLDGGIQRHGYPDPQYLDRVLNELKSKGIVPNQS